MNKKFKLIQGGIKPKEQCEKQFISSYVTDTRLMGAMGLFIRWEVLDCPECDDLVQFFYFDTEEFGIENYHSVWGYDRNEIFTIEHTTIGCLGGKKVPLSEKEACYLVQHYCNMNKSLNLPLPKGIHEYDFVLQKRLDITDEEIHSLELKMCTDILSDYQAVHYCLMRMFGKDFQAALYLCGENMKIDDVDIYPDLPMATFYRNSIDLVKDYFLCESLVNGKDQYYICTTKVNMQNMKVVGLEAVNCFPVSEQEAAMILSKMEYISVYDVASDDMEIQNTTLELSFNMTCTFHESGRLLMAFKNHNNHVNQKVFRLSDDIYGTYFITNQGQFILTAYSKESIRKLEDELMKSSVGKFLIPFGKFAFRESILYDFIGSGFEDFLEFMDAIKLD